ncbi:acyl-CoA-binding domain-containing protein 5A isoform X2 [Astyanax mexicanus]|uniref:acyl-CoA-binding domain-containing protein 5A isoform X2 n=1 Tax=Astyanax mexicanus TaxID=7994 RepID=UPI0020CB697E|nr:acyl-CoA-binding domain-containing protein 5A isoform X2 [Astyanax mexicanus]
MMELESSKPIHEQRFEAAVKVIQSLPSNGSFQPSNEMMLKFYSYYKQATLGPCNIPRPGFWDPVGKAKWDAWNELGDMSQEEAMGAYVDDLKLILESMPMTDEVEHLLQILGPFYELVDERKKVSQVSDLTTARLERFARQLEGLGSMMEAPSKAVTKSIIRTMQMNGTLDSYSTKKAEAPKNNIKAIKEQEERGDKRDAEEEEDEDSEDDDDEEENEGEEVEQVKKVAAPKKKTSNGKVKGLPNGSIGQKIDSVTNGTHSSRSALNRKHVEEIDGVTREAVIQRVNGCSEDDITEDVSNPHHVGSDSDGEVYCDSVDQFGVEESSEVHVNSLEGSYGILSALGEPQPAERDSGGLSGVQDCVQHGGEDWKTSGGGSQRSRLSVDRSGSSVVRRGRGSKSPGSGSGAGGPLQGGGGDGERSDEAVGGDLNEQIVTALARLQEDMQSVLERLHTLEALTASQARSVALSSEYLLPPANKTQKKHSWWPFEVSPGTVAFAVVWPFVVQWLIRLYFQRRRRKIN